MVQFNGVQLNSKIGINPDTLYGHIQGNDFSPDAAKMSTTSNDAAIRQFRLSFQDTKNENIPHQMKNIVTDNNVGKKLDISI